MKKNKNINILVKTASIKLSSPPITIKTDSYKGVRDFYPQDWRFQKWLFWQMADICESFGYENYTASPLEYTELFKAKSGKEIVEKETYNFIDRGERAVTLRPEMTPTIARMISAKNVELPHPIRWYSIPNLFRYEKPQKGRLREHYQLNVDIFGVEGIEAEIELIEIGYKIMQNLGAKDNDYEIKINNRKIINALFNKFLDNKEKIYELSKILDKKNKLSEENFETSIQKILKEKTAEFIKIITNGGLEKCSEFSQKDDIEKVQNLISELEKKGFKNIVFDLTLMRGFDYYTDIVFEFFDTHPENNRSMFGGGRYNDLLDIFGGEKIPAVGFGMGDVTAKNFLEIRNKLPNLKSKTEIAILILDPEFQKTADKIATELRKEGKNIEVDYTYRKIDKQIKSAKRKKIEKMIIVGENELRSEEYKIKNL